MSDGMGDFWRIAVDAGFVGEAEAKTASAKVDGLPVERALSEGLLTETEVDIVEMLRRPETAIRGYRLLSHLGHGGMGVVFRARQTTFDRVVALKTVLVGPQASPTVLARFEQEARTIGRLVHPHLVTAYDYGSSQGRLYLAMEFVDGQDAKAWLVDRHPVDENVVWGIIRQAASGLAYAASAGVIHRDVKPANLLLVTPPPGFPLPIGWPLVKVADFGLALLQDEADERTRLTRDNTTVGSPQYMAPEQLQGTAVDLRADLYSLGATAYHLLAGRAPFDKLPLQQLYFAKITGEPTPLKDLRNDLSPATLDLVSQLMQREPADRMPDYATLLQRIDELLDAPTATLATIPVTGSQPVRIVAPSTDELSVTMATAMLPGADTPARSPSTRRRWLIGSAVALGALGIGIVGALQIFKERPLGLPDCVPTGWGVPCYNGLTLQGWKTESGSWIPGTDDGEGGRVLAGSGGRIAYPLIRTAGTHRTTLANYRLIVVIQRHEAHAAEVQFGGRLDTSSPRWIVRLLKDRVQFGTRTAPHGNLTKIHAEGPLPDDPNRRIEVRIERHTSGWWVSIDDTPLGTAPTPTTPIAPLFYLASEPTPTTPGPAWFSDVMLEELAPRRAPSEGALGCVDLQPSLHTTRHSIIDVGSRLRIARSVLMTGLLTPTFFAACW